jgi:outer membrane receptor protein involved in Fe transport
LKRLDARALSSALLSLLQLKSLVALALIAALAFGSVPAMAQGSTTVSGVATDVSGGPLSGVTITMVGPQTYTATTGDDGTYTISGITPGTYTVTAAKAGYETEREQQFVVAADTTSTLSVALGQSTLNSLRIIGSTSTRSGRPGFNTGPASVNVVSSQRLADFGGSGQVMRVLDQIPGIITGHPGSTSNGASPGGITYPVIRGSNSFETATLIDGHPLAVQTFGDYVTTFLNSNMFQSIEIIKGPGASSPVDNYALNGTVNFRTIDPTTKPAFTFMQGIDNFGGVFNNYNATGTVFNGKLGYVLAYAVDGTPGPVTNQQNYFTTFPAGASGNINGGSISSPTSPAANAATNGIWNNPTFANSTLVGCCFPLNSWYTNKAELAKLRVNFSPVTSFTASYLGSQTVSNQTYNTVYNYPVNFAPGVGYTGNLAPGPVMTTQNVPISFGELGDENEVNNEPIFQFDARTRFKNDTILARYYTASINRLLYDPPMPASNTYTLWGTTCPSTFTLNAAGTSCTKTGSAPVAPTVYNGSQATVNVTPASFQQSEEDRLRGGSFEYDHPFGGDNGDVASFTFDSVSGISNSYSSTSTSIYAGSKEVYNTALLRAVMNFGKLGVTFSNYLNWYVFYYAQNSGTSAAPVLNWATQYPFHYDPRIGLTWRLDPNTSLRLSAGSAIVPPYLSLLEGATAAGLTFAPPTGSATGTTSKLAPQNGLVPETGFGYDFGSDVKLDRSGYTVFSGDMYMNNVFNQFVTSSFFVGNCTVVSSTSCAIGPTGTIPAYAQMAQNISNARYAGIEFSLTTDPPVGFGGILSGSLIRAFPYNVPSSLYCVNPPSCTSFTNLGVVNGINYYSGNNISGTGAGGGGHVLNVITPSGGTAVPYSQGYAELHYRTAHGALGLFGLTYYGPNNAYSVPAFVVANATARFPLGNQVFLQLSGDNLFGSNGNNYVTAFGGVPVQLANGLTGLTNANTVGPPTYRFSLSWYPGH